MVHYSNMEEMSFNHSNNTHFSLFLFSIILHKQYTVEHSYMYIIVHESAFLKNEILEIKLLNPQVKIIII